MTRGKKKGRGRGRGRGSSLRQRLDDADAFAASFGAPPAPPMPTGTSLRASQVDRAVAADMLGAAIDVMDIDVDNEGELTRHPLLLLPTITARPHARKKQSSQNDVVPETTAPSTTATRRCHYETTLFINVDTQDAKPTHPVARRS